MAKIPIKAKDVTFEVEKTADSGTYTRVRCLSDITIDISTDKEEVTCSDSEDNDGNLWKEYEAGANSFSGSGTLFQRRLTNTPAGPGGVPAAANDATNGVSAENLLDYQIAGRKIRMGFTLGTDTGAARYRGTIILEKHTVKGALTGASTASIAFTGTGKLEKDFVQ